MSRTKKESFDCVKTVEGFFLYKHVGVYFYIVPWGVLLSLELRKGYRAEMFRRFLTTRCRSILYMKLKNKI